jgi:hypothetical protein
LSDRAGSISGEGRLRRDPTAPLPWKVFLCSWGGEARAFRRAPP